MKVFIVAALLVASVASQNLDLISKFNKEKSLLKFDRPVYDEVMLKKLGYPVEKSYVYGDNVEVPTYYNDEVYDRQILTIEEMYNTELFREYMSLPLFRQYWSYPMFQRYVASIYFQRFWQVPTFKQYFVNPMYFYKYIFPLVTIFKYQDTTSTYTYGDLYRNKNVFNPFVTGQSDLVQDNKYFVPTVYNNDYKHYDQVYYKNLLDKIYNHLYTYGDVETMKTPFETVFGNKMIKNELLKKMMYKMYTPEIYGDVETIKTPFETMKTPFETIYGNKMVKDALLKKMLINKMYTPEVYGEDKTIFGDKIVKDDLLKTIMYNKMYTPEVFGEDKTIFGDKMIKEELIKKMLLNKMYKPEVFGEETFKTYPEEILREMYHKNMMVPTTDMYKYNPLVARMMYGNKRFNNFETEKMMLNKEKALPLYLQKELQYNKLFDNVNDIEKIETPRMMEKFEHIPLTQGKPIMGVKTFDKVEKMIPEIKF